MDAAGLEATIARVLDELAPRELLTLEQLHAAGVRDEELALLRGLGLVSPQSVDGQERYVGDDVALLRLLGQARRAGLTAKMLPPAILRDYVEALRTLVRVELQMFRAGVVPLADGELAPLTEIATTLSERLVVLLRRKLLLPTLRAMTPNPNEPTP